MGLLDMFKKKSDGLKDQGADLVDGHEEQVETGIDKANDAVDNATGGKFDAQTDKGADMAKDAVNKLDEE